MGWKNVKEHYGIKGGNRIVQVVNGEIYLGVAYVQDLMKISAEGVLLKKDDLLRSDDFERYAGEMEADPAKLRELVLTPDTFEKNLTVYTYEGATIVSKLCEVPGWPNVCHDGQMMFDNTHSLDRSQVVEWARKNALAGVAFGERQVAKAEAELAKVRAMLNEQQQALTIIERDHPMVEPATAVT